MMIGNNDGLNSLVGKSLGQFRIVERIGVGGMAMVFKAYQSTLDRYVAVKVLPAYHASDPVFVKRFEQEARAVAKLAHPHIVQIHDFGSDGDITYIVMEYVDGGTLKDRLKQALPVAEATNFIIQAAEGLECAHRNNLVHRDVKPANMLLRKDGHLLLSDFGIAKILESATGITRAGVGIGTPQYMSPEQSMGQDVDRRSDIYSLGIVFFHCLTGRVPFQADSPITVTVKQVSEPLPVDRLTAAMVPVPIIQVVQQMTAKAPSDRYQSADAAIDGLSNALASSNLMAPRSWRGAALPPSAQPPMDQAMHSGQLPQTGYSQPDQSSPGSTITCFRCGASNPNTWMYCTRCGDDLSNKRASADRYLGPNGRPVLALLSIQNGPMAGRTYRFHQVVTTIGRTNGNDLVISGRTVSRRHARMWFADSHWYLEDLQSANGTMVNNARIYQPVILKDGDVIHFGDEVVVFSTTYGP